MKQQSSMYSVAASIMFIVAMIGNGVMGARETPWDWKHNVIVGLLGAIYFIARSIQESLRETP